MNENRQIDQSELLRHEHINRIKINTFTHYFSKETISYFTQQF